MSCPAELNPRDLPGFDSRMERWLADADAVSQRAGVDRQTLLRILSDDEIQRGIKGLFAYSEHNYFIAYAMRGMPARENVPAPVAPNAEEGPLESRIFEARSTCR